MGSRPAEAAETREYVVGIDGSLASVAAARWAADRAVRDAASLVVVHAYQVDDPLNAARAGAARAMRRVARLDAERLLRSVAEQLPAGETAQQVAVEGTPTQVLLERSAGAELLVVGARPRHNHPHARYIGSTATSCLRAAECPVVLVRGIHSEEAAVPAPNVGPDDHHEPEPRSLGRT